MATVDDLIDRIAGREEHGALDLLAQQPELALRESPQEGALAGATRCTGQHTVAKCGSAPGLRSWVRT